MEHLSKVLFVLSAITFVIGFLTGMSDDGRPGLGMMNYNSTIQYSIALFLASIAAELIWGRRRAD